MSLSYSLENIKLISILKICFMDKIVQWMYAWRKSRGLKATLSPSVRCIYWAEANKLERLVGVRSTCARTHAVSTFQFYFKLCDTCVWCILTLNTYTHIEIGVWSERLNVRDMDRFIRLAPKKKGRIARWVFIKVVMCECVHAEWIYNERHVNVCR